MRSKIINYIQEVKTKKEYIKGKNVQLKESKNLS